MKRLEWLAAAAASVAVLAGCAAPRVAPSADRLSPGELEAIAAARRAGPLTIEQIIQRSRAGESPAALIEETESLLTWLESPGVRMVRGQWRSPWPAAARHLERFDVDLQVARLA